MKQLLIILLGISFIFPAKAGDDPVCHARIINKRTYMNVSREYPMEYWIAKDKYCYINNNQIKTIVRKDLGVVYTILVKTNKYYVDSIKPQQKLTEAGKEPDFKYIGLNYEPVYEWNKSHKLPKDTVANFVCDHFRSEGDADFDQVSLEFSVARPGDRIVAAMFNETMVSIMGWMKTRKPLADMLKRNKYLIPTRFIETVDNPIAPPVTTSFKLDKLEMTSPPENIFELPLGAEKEK